MNIKEASSPPEDFEAWPINVGFRGQTETERVLSNFAATPFRLDGRQYCSVEGFWQGLYFPEGSPEREELAHLSGPEAKRRGRQRKRGLTEVVYQGQHLAIGSAEHQELMRRALKAKFTDERNVRAKRLLLASGNRPITHILTAPDGGVLPDSKSIPGAVFAKMLMDLRRELQEVAKLSG